MLEQFGCGYDAAWNLNYRTNNALVQRFDVNAANELTKYPQLKFEFKTGLEAPAAGPRADKPKAIDWAAMRLQDLRAIAARYGLSGGPRQKKADLIKALTGILG